MLCMLYRIGLWRITGSIAMQIMPCTFGSVLVNFEPHDAKVNVKNAPFPRYNGKYNKKNQKLSTNPNQKYFLALLQTFGTHQKGLRSNIYCLKKANSKIAE